ncbi:MAG: hypothetical protein LBG13_00190 [Holosporales bacterium]|jgi:hypothetical protein|nr:hypothetical protein [Holosporales bacterium]
MSKGFKLSVLPVPLNIILCMSDLALASDDSLFFECNNESINSMQEMTEIREPQQENIAIIPAQEQNDAPQEVAQALVESSSTEALATLASLSEERFVDILEADDIKVDNEIISGADLIAKIFKEAALGNEELVAIVLAKIHDQEEYTEGDLEESDTISNIALDYKAKILLSDKLQSATASLVLKNFNDAKDLIDYICDGFTHEKIGRLAEIINVVAASDEQTDKEFVATKLIEIRPKNAVLLFELAHTAAAVTLNYWSDTETYGDGTNFNKAVAIVEDVGRLNTAKVFNENKIIPKNATRVMEAASTTLSVIEKMSNNEYRSKMCSILSWMNINNVFTLIQQFKIEILRAICDTTDLAEAAEGYSSGADIMASVFNNRTNNNNISYVWNIIRKIVTGSTTSLTQSIFDNSDHKTYILDIFKSDKLTSVNTGAILDNYCSSDGKTIFSSMLTESISEEETSIFPYKKKALEIIVKYSNIMNLLYYITQEALASICSSTEDDCSFGYSNGIDIMAFVFNNGANNYTYVWDIIRKIVANSISSFTQTTFSNSNYKQHILNIISNDKLTPTNTTKIFTNNTAYDAESAIILNALGNYNGAGLLFLIAKTSSARGTAIKDNTNMDSTELKTNCTILETGTDAASIVDLINNMPLHIAVAVLDVINQNIRTTVLDGITDYRAILYLPIKECISKLMEREVEEIIPILNGANKSKAAFLLYLIDRDNLSPSLIDEKINEINSDISDIYNDLKAIRNDTHSTRPLMEIIENAAYNMLLDITENAPELISKLSSEALATRVQDISGTALSQFHAARYEQAGEIFSSLETNKAAEMIILMDTYAAAATLVWTDPLKVIDILIEVSNSGGNAIINSVFSQMAYIQSENSGALMYLIWSKNGDQQTIDVSSYNSSFYNNLINNSFSISLFIAHPAIFAAVFDDMIEKQRDTAPTQSTRISSIASFANTNHNKANNSPFYNYYFWDVVALMKPVNAATMFDRMVTDGYTTNAAILLNLMATNIYATNVATIFDQMVTKSYTANATTLWTSFKSGYPTATASVLALLSEATKTALGITS